MQALLLFLVGLSALSVVLFLSASVPSSGHRLRGPVVDVVGVAVKPSCVTVKSIKALNSYLAPRTIHVVSEDRFCPSFLQQAPNIICHDQNTLLPGVTLQTITSFLIDHVNVNASRPYAGRSLAGWYLQQFLKLGAAEAISNLTTHFVVWDLDMIALRPIQPIVDKGDGLRTIVNIGGAKPPGYALAYRRLLGKRLEYAHDGSSFVTHWMVVYKPYMAEFLRQLGAQGGLSWAWRILEAVDPHVVELGFSEYASYISWVRQHYPESQLLVKKRTWVRHPLGQGALRLAQRLHPLHCCCPPSWLIGLVKLIGYTYTGYEVGHIPRCRYTAPEFADGYCLEP